MSLLQVFRNLFMALLFTKLFIKELFSINEIFMMFLSIFIVLCAVLILILEIYYRKEKKTSLNHKPLYDGVPFLILSLIVLFTDIAPSDTLTLYRWIGVPLILIAGLLLAYPVIRDLPKK